LTLPRISSKFFPNAVKILEILGGSMAKKKFSFLDEVNNRLLKAVTVTKAGEAKIKRADLRATLEEAFQAGVKAAAGGERVRFPVIGALVRKDVKARKAGKGTNPFTGQEMTIKARPASKKPRWSFPKAVKEFYANKRNW
jgi:DNA-binding protein HU-beta